jgi:hypothetical protein
VWWSWCGLLFDEDTKVHLMLAAMIVQIPTVVLRPRAEDPKFGPCKLAALLGGAIPQALDMVKRARVGAACLARNEVQAEPDGIECDKVGFPARARRRILEVIRFHTPSDVAERSSLSEVMKHGELEPYAFKELEGLIG